MKSVVSERQVCRGRARKKLKDHRHEVGVSSDPFVGRRWSSSTAPINKWF